MTTDGDAKNATQLFQSSYDRFPTFTVTAPGRVNLIGEHIDYLDGLVFPAAIDLNLEAAVAPIDEPVIRLCRDQHEPLTIECALADLEKHDTSDKSWLTYIVGVIAGYRKEGIECPGFEAAVTWGIPTGGGLSSSAALETMTALIVETLTGSSKTPFERAKICQRAEWDYAGVPCGIMDQVAVGMGDAGHALMLDCRDLTVTPTPVPKGVAIVIADTGVKHALGDGEYRKRRESCEQAAELLGVASLRDASEELVEANREILGDLLFRRAFHAVTEMERVRAFAEALKENDFTRMGELMWASHDSLKNDYEVSCDELDLLVDAAYEFGPDRGLVGARMTGGGFGGSMVNLVREDAADELMRHLEIAYETAYMRKPFIFATSAAAGARVQVVG